MLKRKYYKTNQYITAPTLRLLDEMGKQIGIVSLDDARKMSAETGLDLVEIVGKATPPIIKLISFSKFKYQEAKKEKKQRKGNKGGEIKEIQFKQPAIGQGDLDTKINKAKGYFTAGIKVKFTVKLRGRWISKKEIGFQLVTRITEQVKDQAVPEAEPKLIGKAIGIIFTPTKKVKTKNEPQQS